MGTQVRSYIVKPRSGGTGCHLARNDSPWGLAFRSVEPGYKSNFRYRGHLHNVALFKIPCSLAIRGTRRLCPPSRVRRAWVTSARDRPLSAVAMFAWLLLPEAATSGVENGLRQKCFRPQLRPPLNVAGWQWSFAVRI